MKISWIKNERDKQSFRLFQNIGLDVFEIKEPEEIDKKMKELISEKYNTIILSNELAGFSQDIIKKYNKEENVNIIIAPRKKE